MIIVLSIFVIALIFWLGFAAGVLSEQKDLKNVARAIGEKNDIYVARSPEERKHLMEFKALMERLDSEEKKEKALIQMTTCTCALCGVQEISTATSGRDWDDPYFGLPYRWERGWRDDVYFCRLCWERFLKPLPEVEG